MLAKSSSYLNKFSCKENVDSVRILNFDRQVKVAWYRYLHTVMADDVKLLLEVCLTNTQLCERMQDTLESSIMVPLQSMWEKHNDPTSFYRGQKPFSHEYTLDIGKIARMSRTKGLVILS